MLTHPTRLHSLALTFFALLLTATAACAQDAHATAFARAQHLRHGINASMWFAQADDYSAARLASYTTPADIALMHRLGFDHVRLSIDADALVAQPASDGLNREFTEQLDKAAAEMLAQNLAVIIDIHPSDEYKQRLRTDPNAPAAFNALWKALAGHFAKSDPERVFFEVLNEPEFTDAARWAEIQQGAIAAIRSQAPQHTVIATAIHYSGLDDLLSLEPVADPNVIYTFHDYEPFPFTHQGATWTTPKVAPLRGVPYPSSPQDITPVLDQEKTDFDRLWLNRYGLDRWDAERIATELSYANRWATEHKVPVYCGEFGVYEKYSNPGMRAAWIRDVRSALENLHIGWAMWDYQGSFALVNKKDGKAVPIKEIVAALGLHPAA